MCVGVFQLLHTTLQLSASNAGMGTRTVVSRRSHARESFSLRGLKSIVDAMFRSVHAITNRLVASEHILDALAHLVGAAEETCFLLLALFG